MNKEHTTNNDWIMPLNDHEAVRIKNAVKVEYGNFSMIVNGNNASALAMARLMASGSTQEKE